MAGSINLGSVYATLELRDTGFNRQIATAASGAQASFKSMEKSSSDLYGSLSNSFNGIADTLGTAIKTVAIFGAAGSFGFGAMIKAAIDQQRAVENAGFALRAYESDGKKVNAVLSQLVSYAQSDLGVLFQREDLFKAASSLKVFGDNTGDLVEHVKILSKGVSLGYTTFEELSFILGRVGAQGKLTGVDFDMLTQRGIKLPDTMRNAAVSFDELFKAVNHAIPDGVLEGRADSIDGRLIRLKSSFRNLGKEILGVDSKTNSFVKGGLGDQFVKTLDKLREIMSSPGVKDSFSRLGKQIGDFSSTALPLIIKGFLLLINNIPTLVSAFAALVAMWAVAKVAAIGFGIAAQVALAPALLPIYAIAAAVTLLVGAFVFLQLRFNIFGKTFKYLRQQIEPLMPLFNAIHDFIVKQLNSAFDSLGRIWKQLVDSFRPLIDQFKEFWSKHGDKVVTVLKYVGAAVALIVLAPLIQSFVIFLGALKLLSVALQFVADHFEGIKQIVVTVLKVAFFPLIAGVKLIQTAMDLFGISWGDVWNGIVKIAKGAKDGIAAAIDYVKDKVDKLQRAFNDFKTEVNKAIDKVREKIQEFKDFIGRIVDTVKGKWEEFTGAVSTTRKNVNESVDKMKTKFNEWKELFKNGFDGGQGTQNLLDRLNGVNKGLADSITNIIKPYKTAVEGIGTSFTTGFESAKSTVSTFFTNIGLSIQTFISNLPTMLSGIWVSMTNAWNTAYTSVTTFFSNAGSAIFTFITTLPEKLSGIWQSMQRAWDTALQVTKDFFNNLFTNTKTETDSAGKNTADSAVNGMKNKFTNFDTIRKVGDAIITMILLAIALVIAYIVDAMFRAGKNIINGLVSGIKAVAGKVWSAIKAAADPIGKFFSGAAHWLYDSGRAIISGLVDGIRSMAGAAKEAAKSVMKGVRDLFPFSPAKEGPFSGKGWTLYSGRSLMEGFGKGIGDMGKKLRSNMQGVMGGLSGDIAGAVRTGLIPSSVGAIKSSSVNNSSNLTIHGGVTIGDKQTADYFFQRLGRQSDLRDMGLVG